jgi:hypothetical protein
MFFLLTFLAMFLLHKTECFGKKNEFDFRGLNVILNFCWGIWFESSTFQDIFGIQS